MAWTVEYLSNSRRQLKRLDPQTSERIVRFMRERVSGVNDPYATGRALTGKWAGHWRYRVGHYRIICNMQQQTFVVMVVKAGHRSDVYN